MCEFVQLECVKTKYKTLTQKKRKSAEIKNKFPILISYKFYTNFEG